MKTNLIKAIDSSTPHAISTGNKSLNFLLLLLFLVLMTYLNGNAQCSQSDILITTNTLWDDDDIQLTENQKITVRGATLTITNCTLRRKIGCSGYWDGIYLEKADNGTKAGLIVNGGTRIEYSQNGITALNGYAGITLDEVEMSDNGRVIRAMDNWPFSSYTPDFNSSTGSRDGGVSPADVGCIFTGTPPKVIIRNGCVLKVFENGNLSNDPAKWQTQIQILGGELNMFESSIYNGTSLHLVAIAQSRGLCKITSKSYIDGFWAGVYKGNDDHILCDSEGLIIYGSEIRNTNMASILDPAPGPGWAVYNLCHNAIIEKNIIEASIWSLGVCYGRLSGNNLYYGDDDDSTPYITIESARNSFRIFDNCISEMNMEFNHDNRKTYASCNKFIDVTYAVVANARNQFPVSWGTLSRSTGNIWDNLQSEMYNLSVVDVNLNYYYYPFNADEEFKWQYQITDISSNASNSYCTYVWPANFAGLDPDDLEVDVEELEDLYLGLTGDIESLIGHYDTTVTTVHEELMYLRSQLSELIGQWLSFHNGGDIFWTDKVDPKVVELQGLDHLWYDGDMFSITEHLDGNPDPDAEALFDAATKMDHYFSNGKNLMNLTSLQVDTLELIASSSFGDYTNILRNYLYMMYKSFIPYNVHSTADSLRNLPFIMPDEDNTVQPVYNYLVTPNPFSENIQIEPTNTNIEDNKTQVHVYNLDGTLLLSSLFGTGEGRLNLSQLETGIYLLKMQNLITGKIETKCIYKAAIK